MRTIPAALAALLLAGPASGERFSRIMRGQADSLSSGHHLQTRTMGDP